MVRVATSPSVSDDGGMDDHLLERVLTRLSSDIDELSSEVADLVHDQQDSYRDISNEALHLAIHRNMETAVKALRLNRLDPRSELPLSQVSTTIQERFLAGIAMEEAMRAFGLCIWRIHQRFLDIGTQEALPHELVLSCSDTLWRLGDAITARVVHVYNELNLQRSLLDAQRRAQLVRRILNGQVSAAELNDLGLDPEREYAAVRCSVGTGIGPGEVARLEASGSLPKASAVLAIIESDCLGVIARVPVVAEGTLVAVGPFVSLAQIKRSYELADRIAHIARYRHLSGVQTLADLTWQAASADQPELTALLRERLIEPLRREGVFGEDIEHSVRTYLQENMSIPKAATRLNLHPNTLRYRLQRFTELTGADLSRPTDLVDVTWALELGGLPPRSKLL